MKKNYTFYLEDDVLKKAKSKAKKNKLSLNKYIAKLIINDKSEKKVEAEILYPTDLNVPAWKEWLEYKKVQLKFTYKSPKYEAIAYKDLINRCGVDHQRQANWIYGSIANGWKGIYEVEGSISGKSSFDERLEAYEAQERLENGDNHETEDEAGFIIDQEKLW